MDGLAFCNAGKRAYHLIKKNLAGLVAINSVGNLVLELAKLLIVIFCAFIGYEILIVSFRLFKFFQSFNLKSFALKSFSLKVLSVDSQVTM